MEEPISNNSSSVPNDDQPTIPPVHDTSYLTTKKPNIGSLAGTILLLVILFFVGFWLSGVLRQYMGNISFFGKTEVAPTPSEMPQNLLPTTPMSQFDSWNTYQVLNGTTRSPYTGISFKLPPDVLSPICDGTSCASQGTYLPGGTRFTVALRGDGQVLPDFRDRTISDLEGKPFTVVSATLSGSMADEFIGNFVGTTVGGYSFARMRGYMMEVTDMVSLEINHFTPSGISADFNADDAVFDNIVKTIVLPKNTMLVSPTPMATITAMPTQSAVPTSTSSGFQLP